MATTWSSLKIALMGAGDESGTWGTVTNANLGTAIQEAIAGSADVTFASADVTLTLTDTTASQTARNMRLNLIGTTGGSPRELVVPAIEKMYVVNNGCADTVTIKVSGQTGVAIPAGKTIVVFNNGTDCLDAITHLRNLTLATALSAASGGTGINAAGTAGNVLTSNGSAWVSSVPTGIVPSGGIIMWSGTIATIPAGWYLCDGTNSTPDLRNKFIIGAYQDNAGSPVTTVTGSNLTTGGSKDAILVSHTHTATVTDPGHSHTYLENTSNEYVGTGVLRTDVFNDQTRNTGTNTTGITVGISTQGSSGDNANLPPFYALAYIMKA
jgi:hypothetical protein